MWNEQAPLELLKNMPKNLNEDNLAQIQEVIDVDKYENSWNLNRDLCGEYAPFCNGCDKWVLHPCARAYVQMMQREGMDVTMNEPYNVIMEETKTPKRIRIAVARRTAFIEESVSPTTNKDTTDTVEEIVEDVTE